MPTETTVRELLEFLAPSVVRRRLPPPWPPDAFAIAASILQESGAYLEALNEWPPPEFCPHGPESWSKSVRELGEAWRDRCRHGRRPPQPVVECWRTLSSRGDLPLSAVGRDRELRCALIQILAAADEASYDIGVPKPRRELGPFGFQAEMQLLPHPDRGSSLCREIHPSKVRVLPKFHTPQTGITIRSLSHHLSLWKGGDVTPLWFTADLPGSAGEGEEEPHSLSLLLIPWPEEVTPKQFSPIRPAHGRLRNMPHDQFGFFTYRHDSDPETRLKRIKAIYEAAKRFTDRIDGVVLPELALDDREYADVRRWVTDRRSILIAGVGSQGEGGRPGRNRVWIEVPTGEEGDHTGKSRGHLIRSFQDKHHRWRLDRSQIVQYGLGGQLDPARSWWESMEARDRHLTFVSLQPWLSLCALVCEDLARQDPVAHLVRTVGPNLVIALLMDGPQRTFRWPARYATVFADDPGSSVLTLTSVGMCNLSRPPGKTVSRTIGLWKDAQASEAIEIDLPLDADAVLLNLARQWKEEWTADGRSDGGQAGYPALAGVHPVRARSL